MNYNLKLGDSLPSEDSIFLLIFEEYTILSFQPSKLQLQYH